MSTDTCASCGSVWRREASLGDLCPICLLRLAVEDGPGPADERQMATIRHQHTAVRPASCRVLTLLGTGRHGPTYLAEHEGGPPRLVTLKAVQAALPPGSAARRIETFLAGQRRLEHASVAPFLGGEIAGPAGLLLTSEYRAGVDIARHLARHGEGDAAALFVAICSAVGHAHGMGLAHGHLVASNLLVLAGPEGPTPLVQHFGVAALAGGQCTVEGDVAALVALITTLCPLTRPQQAPLRAARSLGDLIGVLEASTLEPRQSA